MRQVRLRANGAVLMTWLDDRPSLREGCIVTLKGKDDTKWLVERVYSNPRELDHIDRMWRVGGIQTLDTR